jgi:hypothetical protein
MISFLALPSNPVPAGINLPIITFSFRPTSLSSFPLIAAFISIFVVFWNDAAERKLFLYRDTSEIPNTRDSAVGASYPFSLALS